MDKTANVYQRKPYREFDGWDQERGEALYRSMSANLVLKKANRLTKLLKTAALQVSWNGRRPVLTLLTPNVLDVEFDDPMEPWRFIITQPGGHPMQTRYLEWTAERFSTYDARGHPLPQPDNPRRINPFGALPFVPLFDSFPDDEFFLPGGDDLIEGQRAINIALVNLWRAIELQSHGQAWAVGLPAGDQLRAGPDRTITLPEGGKFEFAAPKTTIEEVIGALEFVIKQLAVSNGLAANTFEIRPRAESGVAKALEQRDLLESREDDLELWRAYEERLFETVKRVVNTYEPGAIPESATVRVDFGEVNEPLDENERLKAYAMRLNTGIWSPVDALMADNPDIRSRDEAREMLAIRGEEAVDREMEELR